MLRRRQRHCAACHAPVDQTPSCPSCGEPYIPEAARFETPRAGAVLSSVLAATVGLGPLALLAVFALEGAGHAGWSEMARLSLTWLPSGLALLSLPIAGIARWLTRVVTRSRPTAQTPLRRAPSPGLADGVRVTVRGRVRLRLAPLEGRPRTAAAARSARTCAGRFDIVLDDGSVVLVDDSDVVLGSRQPLDWLRDAVDLLDGDEVVASGRVRVLDGPAGGYRDASRVLAFDGHALDPVLVIKEVASTGVSGATSVPERATSGECLRPPRVRVVDTPQGVESPEEDVDAVRTHEARALG